MIRRGFGKDGGTGVPADRLHGAVEADVSAEPVDDGLDRLGRRVRHVLVVAEPCDDVVERREEALLVLSQLVQGGRLTFPGNLHWMLIGLLSLAVGGSGRGPSLPIVGGRGKRRVGDQRAGDREDDGDQATAQKSGSGVPSVHEMGFLVP